MKEKISPPLVLMIISIIVSALLVVAYNVTYVNTNGVLTDELEKGCEEIFGKADYELLTVTNEEDKLEALTFDGVTSIIVDKEKKNCIFEIIADGYSKGGLHVLVGISNEGTIQGISFISIAETPGLGTKVQEKSFLDQFNDIDLSTKIDSIDNITGATYSSKGMKTAVKVALESYSEHKGEFFNE